MASQGKSGVVLADGSTGLSAAEHRARIGATVGFRRPTYCLKRNAVAVALAERRNHLSKKFHNPD
jgi:hypothetical protein